MKLIKEFEVNTLGKDYAVGDIHGAFDRLYEALEQIGFNYEIDRLFSVGDLVDRGEASGQYWRLLNKPWFHAVRGNHEDMAIKHFKGTWPSDNYIQNGGGWNFNSTVAEQTTVADDFSELPFMIEVKTNNGTVGLVHANTRGNSWKYMRENIMLSHVQEHTMWSRDRIWGAEYVIDDTEYMREYKGDPVKHIHAVIVGHTPNRKVIKIGNVFHIDTGWWSGKDRPVVFMNLNNLEILPVWSI
jgi:serine/threonine protein phosphatase 1